MKKVAKRRFRQPERNELFRAPDELSDFVHDNWNAYFEQREKVGLETAYQRLENVTFVSRIPQFSHKLQRQESMTRQELVELGQIINDAGEDSVIGQVLGGSETLQWVATAKPLPPPKPRVPVRPQPVSAPAA